MLQEFDSDLQTIESEPNDSIDSDENKLNLTSPRYIHHNRNIYMAYYDEKWTAFIENHLEDVRSDALRNAIKHKEKKTDLRAQAVIFGLPSIIIPIVMTFATQVTDNPTLESSLWLISAVSSSFFQFFHLETSWIYHETYAYRYESVADDIRMILTKSPQFRNPVSIVLSEVKEKMNGLKNSSPSTDNSTIGYCLKQFKKCRRRDAV